MSTGCNHPCHRQIAYASSICQSHSQQFALRTPRSSPTTTTLRTLHIDPTVYPNQGLEAPSSLRQHEAGEDASMQDRRLCSAVTEHAHVMVCKPRWGHFCVGPPTQVLELCCGSVSCQATTAMCAYPDPPSGFGLVHSVPVQEWCTVPCLRCIRLHCTLHCTLNVSACLVPCCLSQ